MSTSELHNPTSAYYDPTLTYEAGMESTVRAYHNIPGVSDEDDRYGDSLIDATQILQKWADFGSDRPHVEVSFDDLYRIEWDEAVDQLNEFNRGREIRPNGYDLRKTINNRLNLALWAPTKKNPNRVGTGKVCMNLSPDAPPPGVMSWDEINAYHPITIAFAEAKPGGMMARAYRAQAYAIAYRTQWTQDEAFRNPATGGWEQRAVLSPFNGTHFGIAKIYREADCGDRVTAECGCAKCEMEHLRRAVMTLRASKTASEHDPVRGAISEIPKERIDPEAF